MFISSIVKEKTSVKTANCGQQKFNYNALCIVTLKKIVKITEKGFFIIRRYMMKQTKHAYKCGSKYCHTRPIINETIFKLFESPSNICTFMILG